MSATASLSPLSDKQTSGQQTNIGSRRAADCWAADSAVTRTSARSNHVLWAANLLNTSATTIARRTNRSSPQPNTKDVTFIYFSHGLFFVFSCLVLVCFFAYSSHTFGGMGDVSDWRSRRGCKLGIKCDQLIHDTTDSVRFEGILIGFKQRAAAASAAAPSHGAYE